jgi:membrane protein DedA with SNARE-associated domain
MHALANVAAVLVSGHQIDHLLAGWGYVVVFGFVAIESLGVPFPGETALITAAIYAATTHHLDIAGVIAAAAAGAIIGDNVGYALGRWAGWRLATRYGRYVRLTERRLKLGRYLFMRHGGKLVFFGRFVSGLRTWAAFLAGTNCMPWRRFLAFNAGGGVVWAVLYGVGYFYAGHALTTASTGVDVALAVVGGSALVAWVIYLRRRERRLQRDADLALPGPLAACKPGAKPAAAVPVGE